jgi:exodeoxyribonuclease V gamma subunit
MAVALYFSNRIEVLAQELAERIHAPGPTTTDPLKATSVLVPNHHLAKWLQLRIADHWGICMQVRFALLEEGLWHLIEQLDPADMKPRRCSQTEMKVVILKVLQDLWEQGDAQDPLLRYLGLQRPASSPLNYRKLWQLTEKMEYLLRAYELNRPDWMHRWQQERPPSDTLEAAQQRLYRRVRQLLQQMPHPGDGPRLSLFDYARQILWDPSRPAKGPLSQAPIYIFGFSQFFPFHLKVIEKLSEAVAFHVYTLNPCQAFVEDLHSTDKRCRTRDRSASDSVTQPFEPLQLSEVDDQPLLAAWGRPGRENIQLLCHLNDYTFKKCFKHHSPIRSVLEQVQADIFTGFTGTEQRCALDQDRSIQVLAVPGRLREVESVYQSILFNLEREPALQLTDIAVLVPDMTVYKPYFDMVFNRGPCQISYNLMDSSAQTESHFSRAVTALLSLAMGTFSRREVLALFMNPCFMHCWKVDAADVHQWALWADALNIFHSYDQKEKMDRGYPGTHHYTWKQGLQRLRIGRIMTDQPPGQDPALGGVHFQQRVPYQDMATSDGELVETFSLAVEVLHDVIRQLNQPHLSCEQWCQRFWEGINRLLDISGEMRGEGVVRSSLAEALNALARYDNLAASEPARHPGLAVISAFIQSHLLGITSSSGDYLLGGVTLSALLPMRPIPFKVIYIMGMEEGGFPGRSPNSGIDLRLQQRRMGDVTPAERNRYLFLEVLLSAREKLYISYISLDLQKARSLAPCSLVLQLCRYIENAILVDKATFKICALPLKPYSLPPGGREPQPAWSDARVNYSLADTLAGLRLDGSWQRFQETAETAEFERLTPLMPNLTQPLNPGSVQEAPSHGVFLSELTRFLRWPVQAWLQRHAGPHAAEATTEVLASAECEALATQLPFSHGLVLQTTQRWLIQILTGDAGQGGVLDAGELLKGIYDDSSRRGRTPEGAFAQVDLERLREQVRQIADTLMPVVACMRAAQTVIPALVIGDAGPLPEALGRQPAIRRMGPCRLTLELPGAVTGDLLLHGQLPWFWRTAEGRWQALVLTASPWAANAPDRHILSPLLAYLTTLAGDSAGEWDLDDGMVFHVVYPQKIRSWAYHIQPAEAHAYLGRLAGSLLFSARPAWLPFDVITRMQIKPYQIEDLALAPMQRELFRDELAEHLADSDDLFTRTVGAPIPEDAFDQARARFGLIFSARRSHAPRAH